MVDRERSPSDRAADVRVEGRRTTRSTAVAALNTVGAGSDDQADPHIEHLRTSNRGE
jgi:hypothetical protein